jgi:hypothetical protein
VPVDHPTPAPAVGPIPHFRKLAFIMGATATVLALMLGTQLVALLQ